MNRRLNGLLAAGLLLTGTAATAHHSAAMFDASKEVTLTGTVKEFQWMSPHCWIQLLVQDAANGNAPAVEWGIEMDNPVGLSRHGWKPRSLQAGDTVTVIAHPLRDGTHGAQVVSVTKDGQLVGNPPAAK
jgi:Family of unknown function (DUF6152)